MTHTVTTSTPSESRRFWLLALGLNAVWINVSEIFRYFAFVMPMTRSAFPQIPDVAPMNLPVFLIWGAWDTLLLLVVTGFSWLYMSRFGTALRTAVMAGTAVWAGIFVIFWLAAWNMRLAHGQTLIYALPLSWLEMVVAAAVVRGCLLHTSRTTPPIKT